MNFKKDWWKFLGVLLMLYTLIAGFKIPLKPGVLDFSKSKAYVGQVFDIDIETYNTQLSKAPSNVWLLLSDDRLIKASKVNTKDDNHISASIPIPSDLSFTSKSIPATIVIDNEVDGFFLYPEGVRIMQSDQANQSTIKVNYHPDMDVHVFNFVGILCT